MNTKMCVAGVRLKCTVLFTKFSNFLPIGTNFLGMLWSSKWCRDTAVDTYMQTVHGEYVLQPLVLRVLSSLISQDRLNSAFEF